MEIEKCRILISAIETGSISAAAEELGYTPSGVSRSIASLEEEMGFPLLIRGKSGVRPTNDCESILPKLRDAVNLQEGIMQSAALVRGLEIGSVVVGTAYPAYNQLLAEMIVSFRELHPGIDITLTEGTSSQLCEQLNLHKLDLAIVSRRDKTPSFECIKKDNLRIWVNKDHPAAKKGVFKTSDLANEKFIQIYPGMETDNSIFLNKMGIKPDICASTNDIYAAYSMVETGLGVALINETLSDIWQGNVIALPMDKAYEVEIGLASQSPDETSSAAAAFAEFIRENLTGH